LPPRAAIYPSRCAFGSLQHDLFPLPPDGALVEFVSGLSGKRSIGILLFLA
jgi:hypothetical protein